MDRFPSYASEREVSRLLSGTAIQTVIRSGLPPSDKRPPFNIVELSVHDFSHLGFQGELRLEFFNDRLPSVWFYPTKFDAYLVELKRRGVAVGTIGKDVSDRNPSIFAYHDDRNQRYVGWADVRLLQQNQRWIERYS